MSNWLEELAHGVPLLVGINEIQEIAGSVGMRLQGYAFNRDAFEDIRIQADIQALRIQPHLYLHDGTDWQRAEVNSTRALRIRIRNADHGLIHTAASLLDDDHTQYLLNAGRAGGQTPTGGTAASERLELRSTSHATKGGIRLGTDDWLEIPEIAAPATPAAGFGRIYEKTADSLLYFLNAAGTEFDLTRAGTVTAVTATLPLSSSGGATPDLSIVSPLTVAYGGTGLSSGTDGGILGFVATGTLASSVLLTANALLLGGGAGATPTPLASLGTTTTLLHGNAAGAPTFAAVATADIADDAVTYPKIQNVTSARLLGRSTAGAGDCEEIAVGSGLSLAAGALTATGGLDITGLTAADPALADESPIYDISVAANRKVTIQEIGGFVAIGVSELRLTLTTGVSVTVADVTAAGTIYLTPHLGNRIRIYDGTRWNLYQTAELSLALVATSGLNYDVFVYDNAGTLTLETTAWTNDTTRATALTAQDGVLVRTAATTRLYVGTIRASAANVTEDSATRRFVWNMYNRVPRGMRRAETTDSWTYTSSTIRQANANTANQLAMVRGLDVDAVAVHLHVMVQNANLLGADVGIGVDSTTAFSTSGVFGGVVHSNYPLGAAHYSGMPGLGYRILTWLESSDAAGTSTWHGDVAAPLYRSFGLTGEVWA